jgi:hypothetical protein
MSGAGGAPDNSRQVEDHLWRFLHRPASILEAAFTGLAARVTRFGRRLAAEFEQEFARLANDWYLEWHRLARGEAIDLDDFRGGRIRLDGMRFDAAAELAYWSAAAHYAREKVEEAFGRAEEHVRARAGIGTEAIAEDTAIRVRAFLERVHRHALFTEYRLKARGYPEERHLAARRDRSIGSEIRRRKVALIGRYRALTLREKLKLAASHVRRRRKGRQRPLAVGALIVLALCFSRDSRATVRENSAAATIGAAQARGLSTVRCTNDADDPVQRSNECYTRRRR